MYEVTVVASFAAAHRLLEYDGNCEHLHGHNWKVEVTLRGGELDRLGMLIDFREARAAVSSVVSELDHKYLNDLEMFARRNPTTENLAREIYERTAAGLPKGSGAAVARVRVWESEGCSASYSGET